MIKFNLLG